VSDLLGKALERPVCDLLGGRVRDRVPYSAYLFYKHRGAGGALGFQVDPSATGWDAARQREALDAPSLVEQAQAMVQAFGFGSIKLKAGVLPPDEEVRTIKLLREAFGPDVPLRIDPNTAWSLETSLRYAPELEGLLEYYEDPVAGKEDMAALARACTIPLATNMCCVSFADLPRTIELGSVSIILGDHHFWGAARVGGACAHLPHLERWAVDAQQLAHGHFTCGDDAPGRRGAQSHLCLRHPLPLAGRGDRQRRQAAFRGWSAAGTHRPRPGCRARSRSAQADARAISGCRHRAPRRRDRDAKLEPGWKCKLPRW
jgi:Enolase C-terminal domain-like